MVPLAHIHMKVADQRFIPGPRVRQAPINLEPQLGGGNNEDHDGSTKEASSTLTPHRLANLAD